jgi:hypothetical protein
MAANSRWALDPTTLLPSVQSQSDISQFLRSAVADEEALQIGDSMGLLASHIETIVQAVKSSPSRATLAPMLMDLLTFLREHRSMVIGLGVAWRGLYEYASYLSALNNFRVLTGQWLLKNSPPAHTAQASATAPQPSAIDLGDFELIAWRTLGEGMLLIDMYDQWRRQELQEHQESALGTLEDPRVERAQNWWDKLRR